jgi:hypothetical protein
MISFLLYPCLHLALSPFIHLIMAQIFSLAGMAWRARRCSDLSRAMMMNVCRSPHHHASIAIIGRTSEIVATKPSLARAHNKADCEMEKKETCHGTLPRSLLSLTLSLFVFIGAITLARSRAQEEERATWKKSKEISLNFINIFICNYIILFAALAQNFMVRSLCFFLSWLLFFLSLSLRLMCARDRV